MLYQLIFLVHFLYNIKYLTTVISSGYRNIGCKFVLIIYKSALVSFENVMLLPFQIVEEVVSPGTCSSSVEHEINVKIIISKYECFI